MKRLLTVMVMLGLTVLGLLCVPPEASEDVLTIGVSYDTNGAFPNAWVSAVKRAGERSKVRILSVCAEGNLQKQLTGIESLVTRKVDAIIIRPKNDSAIIPALEYVKKFGIPVILVDFPVEERYDDLYDVFVSDDAQKEGALQASFVKEWLEENPHRTAHIGYLSGPYHAQNSLAKRDAFYQEMGISSPVAEAECDWSITLALSTTEKWLKTHPEIHVFVCMNDDMAAGVVQALKVAGKDVGEYLVLGMDGNPNYAEEIKTGQIDCTIVRDLDIEGEFLIATAKGLADGVSYPKSLHPDSVFMLTKQNAAAYFEQEKENER